MKKLIIILITLLYPVLLFSSPSNSISIPNSFSPNTTISSSSMNSNLNEVQTKFNAHTHSDITELGAVTSGTWNGNVIDETYGGTGNAYGIGLPSGAIFFMMTGSCPSGTTDVSTTYANKFIKVNATQGTSSGTVLTGTSDSHTLTTTEMPSHTHSITTNDHTGEETPGDYIKSGSNVSARSATSGSVGSDGGHTHTLSAATTLEPSSVTCKMCQVD